MSDSRLKDRIAIITGGSSGIGKATATLFAQVGARIVIADLRSSGVEDELNKKHGPKTAKFIQVDTTQDESVRDLIAEAAKWSDVDRIDIVCNFAGTAGSDTPNNPVSTHDRPIDNFDKTLAVNTRGVYLSCKHAIGQMMKQDPLPPNYRGDRTRGWIVNAASILGTVAFRGAVAYTTSKFAVVGMTKALALEYAQEKIHVNALCPGFVRTPMIANMVEKPEVDEHLKGLHPWGELGEPEDIARAALFLCSDEAAWITGHHMLIDGGYTAQ